MLPSAPHLVLRGHQGAVYDLAWNNASNSWISAGGDGVLASWKHGEENGTAIAHHTTPFYATAIWEEAVVGGNATGELFMHTPKGHRILSNHEAPVFSLFADKERALWSGDGDGNICRWEMATSGPVMTHQWETTLGKVRHISEHPSGLIAAGGSGSWMVIHQNLKLDLPVHAHERSCYWAHALTSKQAVLSGGQDGQLKVHQGNEELLTMDIHQSAVYRCALQGEVLWTCGRDKDVKAWDTTSLNALGKLPRPHARSVNALLVGGPNASFLATAGDDRTIKIWAL